MKLLARVHKLDQARTVSVHEQTMMLKCASLTFVAFCLGTWSCVAQEQLRVINQQLRQQLRALNDLLQQQADAISQLQETQQYQLVQIDRRVAVNGPFRLYMIENFLSEAEIQLLLGQAERKFENSTILSTSTEDYADLHTRSSQSAYIFTEDIKRHAGLSRIKRKIHQLALMPMMYGEDFQVTRYREGEKYEFHSDSSVELGRLATVLVYLSDVEEGGETVFPTARWKNIKSSTTLPPVKRNATGSFPRMQQFCDAPEVVKFKPTKGTALLWFSHLPNLAMDPFTVHGGCPVKTGQKVIAQQWFRWYAAGDGNQIAQALKISRKFSEFQGPS